MEHSWTVPTLAAGFLAGKFAGLEGIENPYLYRAMQIGCYGLVGLGGINMLVNPKNDITEPTHDGLAQSNLQQRFK